MAPSLSLPDVTVCAADSAFVDLTARALTLSMAGCRFGDAILFSDKPASGPFRHVAIEPLTSIEAYSRFCLHRLPDLVATEFALVVQWDGYVVSPAAWSNSFRKYDYIGAAWHGLFKPGVPLVGNGGFSLRSRKLLQAAKRLPLLAGMFEDRIICHVFAGELEQKAGIRFAPVKVADRFSYEYRLPEPLPFGFHGVHNMWRHTSDEDFAAILGGLAFDKLGADKLLWVVRATLANGYAASTRAAYGLLRGRYAPPQIEKALASLVGAEAAAKEMRALAALTGG